MTNDTQRGESAESLRRRLTPMQYRVTQLKETEPPFTGRYLQNSDAGAYRCVVCGLTLFMSGEKYDSGCGWPSFRAAAAADAVREREDRSHGMVRTEIVCRRCGAHLGHLFDDGPRPTGRRYCVNSASLDFATNTPSAAGTAGDESGGR